MQGRNLSLMRTSWGCSPSVFDASPMVADIACGLRDAYGCYSSCLHGL